MSKTLYFEGVGCECQPDEGAIHRMRIRTVFHGKDGNPVFMEVTGAKKPLGKKGEHIIYELQPYACFTTLSESLKEMDVNGKTVNVWNSKALRNGGDVELVESTQVIDNYGHTKTVKTWRSTYRYRFTEAGVLEYLHTLGYDFDDIVVLPDLSGYSAVKDSYDAQKKDIPYNYGDDFEPDWNLIAKRHEFEQAQYERDIRDGIKHPCFSLWVDVIDPHLLHYKNYRRNNEKKLIHI